MKYFVITLLIIVYGNDLSAKDYFTDNYADTVFSQNDEYALVGELIPKERPHEDVPPICGHQNGSPREVNVKLLKKTNGHFKLENSYALETSMFFCLGKDCKMFITNDGKYVVKEVREYAPIKGENYISIAWDVFKIKDDTIVECKAKDIYLSSLRLFDLLSLYPNERLRFMRDYSYRFDRDIESKFFLSVEVNKNIDVEVRYYSVKEKKYIKREITVVLEDLCYQIAHE